MHFRAFPSRIVTLGSVTPARIRYLAVTAKTNYPPQPKITEEVIQYAWLGKDRDMGEEVFILEEEIYKEMLEVVTEYWSEPIDVSEIELISKTAARIPELVKRHDEIETQLDRRFDDIEHGIVCCIEPAVFACLHKHIRENQPQCVSAADINFTAVKNRINSYDEWEIV